MGWLVSDKPRNVKDHLDASCRGGRYSVLDSALVALTEYYAALRNNETGEVFCLIALVRFYMDGQMGVKDLDETAGTGLNRCPERILDLLSPTENEYALQFRADCREYHRQRSWWRGIADGDVIEFRTPIRFVDGVERAAFTVSRTGPGGRSVRFRPVDEPYINCRISNFRTRPARMLRLAVPA